MHHAPAPLRRHAALRLVAGLLLGLFTMIARADILYFTEDSGNVKRVAENGTITTIGTGMTAATGLGMNSLGELFVASQYGYVYKIDAAGNQSQFASISGNFQSLAIGADNRVYVGNEWDGGRIHVYEANGTLATIWNSSVPYGLTFGPDGRLYAADSINNRIVAYDANGVQSVIWSFEAQFQSFINPMDLAFDVAGNLYMSGGAQRANGIYKITPDGVFSTLVAQRSGLQPLVGVEFDSEGNIYSASKFSNIIQKTTPNGTTTNFLTKGDNDVNRPVHIIAVAAVPEPSAFAAILGVLTLAIAVFRRHAR